jgi:hypothetical protein
MFQTILEKIKTYILCAVTVFSLIENLADYDIAVFTLFTGHEGP